MQLKVKKDELTVVDDGSLVSKLIVGCKGNITIKTPLGVREIKRVKKVRDEGQEPRNLPGS